MSIEHVFDESEPLILGMIKAQSIDNRYILPKNIEESIRAIPYRFGYAGFSEAVYYRTYSRLMDNGVKEDYPDTVLRVVNGIISIAKDYRIKHGLLWDEERWNDIAYRFGVAFMKMQLLPPGRGLWISGSEYSYKRGSVAFNNCGFCSLKEGLIKAACWTMDSLMCGCGIGFDTDLQDDFKISIPNKENGTILYHVHDSREGWVKSLYLLLNSYISEDNRYVEFDYSYLRPIGVQIKGFGGESSGYEPLRILHERIRIYLKCYYDILQYQLKNIDKSKTYIRDAIIEMTKSHIDIYPESNTVERPSLQWALSELENMPEELYLKKTYGKSRLVADIFNSIGICIVAGNVRRSSEIALGSASDFEFRNLKNFSINPERGIIAWMSNNTVCLDKTEDFEMLPEIAECIKINGEPGIFNRLNAKRYGRIGRREPIGREAEEDKAIGLNPCSEIELESFEYCNLAEIFPTRCDNYEEMKEAAYLATIYTSTVATLSTHWTYSNAVIARNRRIGVSISGITEQIARTSVTDFTKLCRSLYKVVRQTNKELANELGIPESIRVTTVKPSGTISQLVGVSSGVHHNTYRHCIRRMRIGSTSKLVDILKKSGYSYEVDRNAGEGTLIFSFPLFQGDARTAEEVSVWEQANNLALLQREWADNSVSCTLYFKPEMKDGEKLEAYINEIKEAIMKKSEVESTESDILGLLKKCSPLVNRVKGLIEEGNNLEHVLAHFAPIVKCLSVLPHSEEGVYEQAPYEKITEEEYYRLSSLIKPLNMSGFVDDAIGTKGCDGDICNLKAYHNGA